MEGSQQHVSEYKKVSFIGRNKNDRLERALHCLQPAAGANVAVPGIYFGRGRGIPTAGSPVPGEGDVRDFVVVRGGRRGFRGQKGTSTWQWLQKSQFSHGRKGTLPGPSQHGYSRLSYSLLRTPRQQCLQEVRQVPEVGSNFRWTRSHSFSPPFPRPTCRVSRSKRLSLIYSSLIYKF